MASEEILDLKRRAIALKEAGDTNGAMVLLGQARDLEFEHASVEDLWEPLKLKQFAVVMKKRGDLDAARQALIKAKQIEKGELTQGEASQSPPQAEQSPTVPAQKPAQPAAQSTGQSAVETPSPPPQPQQQQSSVPLLKEEDPVVVEENNNNNDDNDDADALKELMALDQPAQEEPNLDDVEFTVEEMCDKEMMTEFQQCGMPVPSDENYQTKILECKKAAVAAKQAGNTAVALQQLQRSKVLEAVRVALSQGAASSTAAEEEDGWLNNLNAEESALLGELLPGGGGSSNSNLPGNDNNNDNNSDRLEVVMEELAGFLEDPTLFMDALEMGMEVPSVEELEQKAEQEKMTAVEHKKAGDLEGAKASLLKSKQFTAYAQKLKAVLEHVERKKKGGNGGAAAVQMEDLEALLAADEKRSKPVAAAAPKAAPAAAVAKPAEKTADQLKEEAIRLRDAKKIKEAGEVLKLYKITLKKEQDAAEMRRRQELTAKIRKEIDFANHQIQILEYYQKFCDPETQQIQYWNEYITRCTNASKVIMAKGSAAVKVGRKKTAMMCAKQTGLEEGEEEDFNTLLAGLIDSEGNSDPDDERLEIYVMDVKKIHDNSNLQKLLRKQKRENLPDHPSTVRLEVHLQLPPNEHDTEAAIELAYEPASSDPLKKLELTTEEGKEKEPEVCVFEKSQYVDLERGNSPYGKVLRRRIERNKKIQITAYYAPIVPKKGWFHRKKDNVELPPPTMLGKVTLEMGGLMAHRCIAAGEFPLMNGSGSKELGGSLRLAVRTGVPIKAAAEEDGGDGNNVARTKTSTEPYAAMVFSLANQPPQEAAPAPAPATAAEI